MKVLMYDNDPSHLILVDGNEVINGSYRVKKERDGTYSNAVNKFRAVHVMNFPMKPYWEYEDVVDALEKCEKVLREKLRQLRIHYIIDSDVRLPLL